MNDLIPAEIKFPSTWRKESIEWATARQLPQSAVDNIEIKLVVFRQKRDELQAQRRSDALPSLEARKQALGLQMSLLRSEIKTMGIMPTKGVDWFGLLEALAHNHKRDGLYSKLLELSWEYQTVCRSGSGD